MEKSWNFQLKKFKYGELKHVFNLIFEEYNIEIDKQVFSCRSVIDDITYHNDIYLQDLNEITELNDRFRSLSIDFKREKNRTGIRIFASYFAIHVSIETGTIEEMNKLIYLFKNELNLEEYIKDETKTIEYRLDRIEEKIDFFENIFQEKKRKLRCFVSLRFDEESKKYFYILKEFLNLIDIEVESGLDYEPRRISDKVISKLESNIDFVIYLIIGDESYWTRDEIVVGTQMGYILIPLFIKGVKFTAGIFADLEYIEFEKDKIETSFIKILQGIRFIKESKNQLKQISE
jgi:hypothetical protein